MTHNSVIKLACDCEFNKCSPHVRCRRAGELTSYNTAYVMEDYFDCPVGGGFFLFFFSSRRRHTRLQGDWSSDVCSSDLSGSGKSTLVNLLPRFYDAGAGSVRIDGRDVRDYALRNLREQIAVVSQDVVLLDRKSVV